MRALTFLVIDDNQLQRSIVDSCLESAGHQVMFATSADEVSAILAAHDAAVVVLAATLSPDEAQAALTVALRPRRDPETFALLPPPAVIIGASDQQRAQAAMLIENGAAGFVRRPYDRARLVPQLELYSVGAAPSTVLVIDDSRVTRSSIASILDGDGHTVIEASDGREGIALVRKHPEIGLVLSDVIMPEIDGFGVCQAIRAGYRGDDLPIILLTSLDDIGSQSRAVEAGADDFLTKPIKAAELQMRVRTTLRLKGLQRALLARNEELLDALKIRERLSRMLVHDFRNPLTQIVVSAELIENQPLDPGQEEILQLAREIDGAATRITGMTEDLLQVARIEDAAARPDRAAVPLDGLILDIVRDMQALGIFQDVTIEAQIDAAHTVHIDRAWIYRVLQNLVGNALEYSPKGARIVVATKSGDARLVNVYVADQGPGIPEKYRKEIFQQFAQLPKTARQGVGLGLTFCRLAVEAHGGSIAASDRDDGHSGTVFTFTLPLA